MTLEQILPYFLPPLLGALIGYVTNYIAIRMLFRPLKPWRFIGLRVPMTPGIIPAKRHELAHKMGEMVGAHLVTATDVGSAFEKEAVRTELKVAVTSKLGRFLDRDLGPLETLVPDRFRPRFRQFVTLMHRKIGSLTHDYLLSERFEAGFRGYLQREGDKLLARDLSSYLSPERYRALQTYTRSKLNGFLMSPAFADEVGRFVDRKTEAWVANDRPLREMLPDDLVALIHQQIEKELPPLIEKFGGMLYDPDFRERMVEKGKAAIDSFLDSLGGLSGLLAGFINLDTIYAKIPEFLDKAGDEIAAWLKEDKTQEQLAMLLRERVDGLLERSPASYLENMSYEKVAGMRRFVREQAVATVQSQRVEDALQGALEEVLSRVKDRSFKSVLDDVLPAEGLEQLRRTLADRCLELIRSAQAREAFDRVLQEQAEEWIFNRPLGLLSARMPADLRTELETGLCQAVEDVLKKEAPQLVETLNVRRMVEEKVNSLDLLQVEGLLMGIMKEQFKYINLFGALLGLLIGTINLLLIGLS
ncbi:MAG: hypothetical protein C0618_10100 [Desulfuromonas sp.]|nr:MAG: hypothetical protein C0618_10100 [Desulfuromonas sp.]